MYILGEVFFLHMGFMFSSSLLSVGWFHLSLGAFSNFTILAPPLSNSIPRSTSGASAAFACVFVSLTFNTRQSPWVETGPSRMGKTPIQQKFASGIWPPRLAMGTPLLQLRYRFNSGTLPCTFYYCQTHLFYLVPILHTPRFSAFPSFPLFFVSSSLELFFLTAKIHFLNSPHMHEQWSFFMFLRWSFHRFLFVDRFTLYFICNMRALFSAIVHKIKFNFYFILFKKLANNHQHCGMKCVLSIMCAPVVFNMNIALSWASLRVYHTDSPVIKCSMFNVMSYIGKRSDKSDPVIKCSMFNVMSFIGKRSDKPDPDSVDLGRIPWATLGCFA